MNEIEIVTEKLFEDIKHIDEYGNEYWEARELQEVLGYLKWENFYRTILKAIKSCESAKDNSLNHFPGFGKMVVDEQNNVVLDHFVQADKMVLIGSGAFRQLKDYKLSRYACYLIVMLGDEHKEVVSLGRKYFAIQTRRSELRDISFENLSEDKKRLILREETRKGNKSLNREAVKKGVRDLAKFTNDGYRGLYDGETAEIIAKRKGLRYREEILDRMGSEELAANAFRITQTDAALRRQEEVDGKKACETHFNVGKTVRDAIKEIGGTMPEDLPTPKRSVLELQNNDIIK